MGVVFSEDFDEEFKVRKTISAHTRAIGEVAYFSKPHHKLVVQSYSSGDVNVWDCRTFELDSTITIGRRIFSMIKFGDDFFICSGTNDSNIGVINIFSLADKKVMKTFTFREYGMCNQMLELPDLENQFLVNCKGGEEILRICQDGTIAKKITEVRTNYDSKMVLSKKHKHSFYVNLSSLSGNFVHPIERINFLTSEREIVFKEHKQVTHSLCIFHSELKSMEYLITGDLSGNIYFYDSNTSLSYNESKDHCLLLHKFSVTGSKSTILSCMIWSTKVIFQYLLVGDNCGNLYIYDVSKRKELSKQNIPNSRGITDFIITAKKGNKMELICPSDSNERNVDFITIGGLEKWREREILEMIRNDELERNDFVMSNVRSSDMKKFCYVIKYKDFSRAKKTVFCYRCFLNS